MEWWVSGHRIAIIFSPGLLIKTLMRLLYIFHGVRSDNPCGGGGWGAERLNKKGDGLVGHWTDTAPG